MSEVVDFAARRFAAQPDAKSIAPVDAVREALRRIEAGEWTPESLVIVGLQDAGDDDDSVEGIYSGKASTTEFVGILYRAQRALIP